MVVKMDLSSFDIEALESLHKEFLNNRFVSYSAFLAVDEQLTKKRKEIEEAEAAKKPKFRRYAVTGRFAAVLNEKSEQDAEVYLTELFTKIPGKVTVVPHGIKTEFFCELSLDELIRQEREAF